MLCGTMELCCWIASGHELISEVYVWTNNVITLGANTEWYPSKWATITMLIKPGFYKHRKRQSTIITLLVFASDGT